jgi:hypothetical protein
MQMADPGWAANGGQGAAPAEVIGQGHHAEQHQDQNGDLHFSYRLKTGV